MNDSTLATPSTRTDLGSGVYSLQQLRSFLGVSGTRKDAERALPWLTEILNPVQHRPRAADYSFSDLISLFVVRELLKRGVRPGAIREAELHLRDQLGTDRPFVSEEIQTDGHHVYFDEQPVSGRIEAADLRGQQVIYLLVKDRLTRVHYRDGTAAYWTPTRNVLVDPRVQFGEPVVTGTRVTTEVLAEAVEHFGLDQASRRLDVPTRAARSAVRFQNKLTALSV
jgi:hypothetical protein